MRVTCNRQTLELPEGSTVAECLRAFGYAERSALAAMCGNRVAELGDPVRQDCALRPLTVADEEGRRIYERSLRFVMLLALRRLYPRQQVRMEYSVGQGVYVRLPGQLVDSRVVRGIADEMRQLIAEDLPFLKREWNLADAIRYFELEGQPDKLALLRTRPYNTFTMYRCGEMWEYFYGAMVPSTGYVPVFELVMMSTGFVLQLPDPARPGEPAPYMDRPKHLRVFEQSSRWCAILGTQNTADLHRLVDEKEFRSFIRVNEAFHEQALGEIARDIVSQGHRVVLVAGPSSSGKTTFAGRLAVQLRVLGRHAYRVSLDDYYLDRDTLPREADGSLDLETLYALDLPLLQAQVNALLRGEAVTIPRFSFRTGKRAEGGEQLRLGHNELVIFEGIHALNPLLSAGIPEEEIHRVFVSALTCLNLDDHNRIRTTDVRLLRRIVRDHQFRNTPPEQTLSMWPSVRRGEERWIFPCQEMADSMYNTALHYELPVLRHFAYDLLDEVREDSEGYVLARRLMKMLHYVPDIPEGLLSEIPPLSLLREFIGGCTMEEAG